MTEQLICSDLSYLSYLLTLGLGIVIGMLVAYITLIVGWWFTK
jgi:hypothetical protein